MLVPNTLTGDAAHANVDSFAGFSVRETGGTASVTLTFKDTNVSGAVLWEQVIPAGESRGITFSQPFNTRAGGVYVDLTGTGTITGVLLSGT